MRKLTILDTVEDIYRALEGKAYLSALALALTIPDILSKVEYPDEGKVVRPHLNPLIDAHYRLLDALDVLYDTLGGKEQDKVKTLVKLIILF